MDPAHELLQYLQSHGIESHITGHGSVELVGADQKGNRFGHFFRIQGHGSRSWRLCIIQNEQTYWSEDSTSIQKRQPTQRLESILIVPVPPWSCLGYLSHGTIFQPIRPTPQQQPPTTDAGAKAEAEATRAARIAVFIMVNVFTTTVANKDQQEEHKQRVQILRHLVSRNR